MQNGMSQNGCEKGEVMIEQIEYQVKYKGGDWEHIGYDGLYRALENCFMNPTFVIREVHRGKEINTQWAKYREKPAT